MVFNAPPEESDIFTPKFDERGLLTAVVTDWENAEILMVATMNQEAVNLTVETGIAHFWSRSRQQLWQKGESSGNFLSIKEIWVDCDQDALWLKVDVRGEGKTCHTGRKSCFYRRLGEKTKLIVDPALPKNRVLP